MIKNEESALAMLAALSLAAPALGYDWREWPVSAGGNGHLYALTTNKTTWYACQDEAIAAGGHLVTINNAAENVWLYQQFGTPGQRGNALWIGFSDHTAEGHWQWVGGDGGWWEKDNPASTSYVNWYVDTGEPNGGMWENAAIINYVDYPGEDRHGCWTDADENRMDSDLNGGIIEIDVPLHPALGLSWSNGFAQLAITGEIGRSYVVEFVTSFSSKNNWETIATNSLTTTPQMFTDMTSVGASRRFYRVRLVP